MAVVDFRRFAQFRDKLYFHWYALVTMESMNRLEDLRQTKPITEKWISTVREQEGGGEALWGKAGWMNEWKHIGHPEFSPLSPAVSPDRWLLHCLAAQALLGTNPVFCPNYQLRFAEEGQRGEKISPSTPLSEPLAGPARSWRSVADGPGLHLRWGLSSSSPLQFAHTQPPDHNPLSLSVGFNQVAYKFTKTPEAVTCSDRKPPQDAVELKWKRIRRALIWQRSIREVHKDRKKELNHI